MCRGSTHVDPSPESCAVCPACLTLACREAAAMMEAAAMEAAAMETAAMEAGPVATHGELCECCCSRFLQALWHRWDMLTAAEGRSSQAV